MTFDQTHWIATRRKRPLPTYYYRDHFLEMLEFVAAHYDHALLDEHRQFIEDFHRLARDAQCLYVRVVNRKGQVFARDRLRYPELGDQQPILEQLQARDWVGRPAAAHYDDVLGFLTRREIYEVLLPRFAGLARSLKKNELVCFARENLSGADFLDALRQDRILVQLRADEARYLLFLYFGRVQDGLSRFTMRDLGLVRTQSVNSEYQARFGDRAEALEHYFFAIRLKTAQSANAPQLADLAAELETWPEPHFAGSARLRDELAYILGRKAEKAGHGHLAEKIYRRGESGACSERLMRLLLTSGRSDEARAYLERSIDNPRSDEELLVARDLYERKFASKRTSRMTDLLRSGEIIEVDESLSGSPERAAIDYYTRRGLTAYRTENLMWRTLFGLLFWDELFDHDEASVHSPFESLPATLVNGTFYDAYRQTIDAKLTKLGNDPAALKQQLLSTGTRYYGRPNGVFRWRRSMFEALFALLDHADGQSLAVALRNICQDYSKSRYGYPDLMVIDDGGVRFVEIKTEGDQLRRNQLLCIEQLRKAGLRADIARIRWILDPEQVYVVVDVETTGGRGDRHRVTEIGAVKVQGGAVVDRFQTLLNPQRVIPAGITRLTGITPAMVEDAPYFADIADEFEAFIQGAIFVAHNVEFDYGFVASEFRRLGRAFRYPKLCTCASMRKLYPGHRSYSLAALCREFDIPLNQHHRALCDAEAAAELLLLVNEKRQAG